ncbi:MAG: MerC family mercury resistance protein [Gammaproteobacteria bacterium]|nr:MerC family mercury resistance protein [Gammaproteobacteria bacterium]
MTDPDEAPGSRGSRHGLPGMWTRGTAGVAATVLAILACYGTLALAALLPVLGLRLAVSDAAWSGAILLFTLLAVLAIVAGARRYRSAVPAAAAVVGAGLVAFALLVNYHAAVELAGFVLLAGAAWRDAVLRRSARPGAQLS